MDYWLLDIRRLIEQQGADIKEIKGLLHWLSRTMIVMGWFTLASVLNWNPQKVAELLALFKGLKP